MTRSFQYSLVCLVTMVSLLILPAAGFAEGQWIKTDEGYNVWDDLPSLDRTATWSGGVDAEGYVAGKGVLQWFSQNNPLSKYDGDMLGGKRDGQGTMTFAANSACFEGSWRDNKLNGYGRWRLEDGGLYEGNWLDGFQHGRGTMVWANGERYEGDWDKGERTGQGIFIWPNGARYQGEFKNGKCNGKGVLTTAGGDRYEGDFADGNPHGQGTFQWATGVRYEGEWVSGAMHGRGVCYFPSGVVQKGQWANGKFIE